MLLLDVNVLVYAFDASAVDHERHLAWLTNTLEGDEPVGIADTVLAAFVRIVTHPRILARPASLDLALAFAAAVRAAPATVSIVPGGQLWTIFERTCRTANARGNLVPDAYLAALAIEQRATLITTDRDFSRFTRLHVRHPLTSTDAPPV
ncbi:MAG: TA system VapC family ribonuclease toxin [Candidatus Limnocylindria bacterium]